MLRNTFHGSKFRDSQIPNMHHMTSHELRHLVQVTINGAYLYGARCAVLEGNMYIT